MEATAFSILMKPGDALTQEEKIAIANLFTAAFEEDFLPFQQVFIDPVHILGMVAGNLVSHALWITRWTETRDRPGMRTAYIEAVATNHAHRGLGYATQIMRYLAKKIQDYDLGALSPANTSLYARLGWEYWQGPLYARKGNTWVPIPGERAMILRTPQTPPLNLRAPLSIEWRAGEVW